jgi:urease accessory protein
MKLTYSLAAWLVFPAFAHAHAGGPAAGLADGFIHPVTGLDHLAAMLAVGLWAAQRGGRSIWLLPLAFVSVMTLGAVLGAAGVSLLLVEPAIVASVLVLGALLATAAPLPLAASVVVVGLCAVFHGHAHGAEMPATAGGLAFVAGFVSSTAGLHALGMGLGLAALRGNLTRLVRFAGGAIVVCGLYLCMA